MKNKEKTTKYSQLKREERMEIAILRIKGYSIRNIAQVLKRSPSTISREISRNRKREKNKSLGSYDSKLAQNKTRTRRKLAKYQGRKILEREKLKQYIEEKIRLGWPPQIISGRMKLENKSFYVSKTAIYSFLYSSYGQYLCKYLPSKRYDKRKRRKKKGKRTLIPNRIGIENRPKEATLRLNYGHWETDAIVSGKKTKSKSSLVVVLERKARYVDIKKIKSLKPRLNNKALGQMFKKVKVKTLTMDNGIENTKHEELSINCFFCNPYSSWEKGGVENINKLIRRWIPKGTDISLYSEKYIQNICNWLNNIPRKILGYKTPLEIMLENKVFKQNKTLKNVLLQRPKMLKLNIKKQQVSVALRG